MKTGILTYQIKHGRAKGSIGSSVIRGDWLVDAWEDAELWHNGGLYDAMIFQKVYWNFFMEDFKGVKILDMCDPDWMHNQINLKEISLLVDAITTSSEPLKEYIEKIVDCPVVFVPDRVNTRMLPKPRTHKKEAKTVVWFGYSGNADEVLRQVLPSLKANGYKLLVVSEAEFNPVNNFGVEIENVIWNNETAHMNIRSADFAINPRSIKRNFKYKSTNKTLISWALGLPVVETADDLAKYKDPVERQKESDLRLKEIEEKWDIKHSVNQLKELIWDLKKNQEKKQ